MVEHNPIEIGVGDVFLFSITLFSNLLNKKLCAVLLSINPESKVQKVKNISFHTQKWWGKIMDFRLIRYSCAWKVFSVSVKSILEQVWVNTVVTFFRSNCLKITYGRFNDFNISWDSRLWSPELLRKNRPIGRPKIGSILSLRCPRNGNFAIFPAYTFVQ